MALLTAPPSSRRSARPSDFNSRRSRLRGTLLVSRRVVLVSPVLTHQLVLCRVGVAEVDLVGALGRNLEQHLHGVPEEEQRTTGDDLKGRSRAPHLCAKLTDL